jgi:hypothetical protein
MLAKARFPTGKNGVSKMVSLAIRAAWAFKEAFPRMMATHNVGVRHGQAFDWDMHEKPLS